MKTNHPHRISALAWLLLPASLICSVAASNTLAAANSLAAMLTGPVPEPAWAWVQQGGGSGYDFGGGIASDAKGNIYVAGIFEGTAIFGTNRLTTSTYAAMFLAKHDRNGNLLWVKQDGDAYVCPQKVALDAAGNIYIAGYFEGVATFGRYNLRSRCEGTAFVLKYDSTGQVVWAVQADGSGCASIRDLAVSTSGEVYLAGEFGEEVVLGPQRFFRSGTYSDFFLWKLDNAGQTIWARQIPLNESDPSVRLCLDGADGFFIAGRFEPPVTLDSITLTNASGHGYLVARYDGAGHAVWVTQAEASEHNQIVGCVSDPAGSLYIAGNFHGTNVFGTNVLVNTLGGELLVAKFSPQGELRWVQQHSGSAGAFGIDPLGQLYLAGERCQSPAAACMFVARLNNQGEELWRTQTGSTNYGWFEDLALDPAGNVFLLGGAYGPTMIGTNNLSNNGGSDIFVAKLTSGVLAPLLTVQPQDLTTNIGTTAVFEAVVMGAEPMSLQWHRNSLDLVDDARCTGATERRLVLRNTQPGDEAGYALVASNSFGSVTSTVAGLTVNPTPLAPRITGQPVPATVWRGEAARFSASFTGSEPLYFQWLRNGAAILEATNATFLLPQARREDAGLYSLVVSNAAGLATSSNALLTVLYQPQLGEALDAEQLVWRTGGLNPWFGQTGTAHDSVDAAQTGELTGYGETWLETTVTGPGLVSFWWKVSTLRNWYFLSFWVDGELSTNYTGESDWRHHSFYLPAGEHVLRWDYARYDEETGGQDAGWLDQVSFTAGAPVAPLIVGPPESQVVTVGDDVTLGVMPEGTEPFHYQWQLNGANLPGVIGQFLRLTNVQRAQAGQFSVMITNLVGETISPPALLTVNPSPVNYEWACSAGGFGVDSATAVAVDPAGNVYVSGQFSGIATFGTNTLTSSGANDLFLAKYDSQGHQLWLVDLTDSGSPTVTELKTAPGGNLLLGGYFDSLLTLSTNHLSAPGRVRFIAKLDSAGQALWVHTFGGTPGMLGYAGPQVATAPTGEVYVLANFQGNTTFGGFALTNTGGMDFFLARIGAEGSVRWAQAFGTTNWDYARSVAVDGAGHVYFSGEFQGSLRLGTNTLVGRYYSSEPSNYGIFLAKCQDDGQVVWAQLGETNCLHGYELAVDTSNHLYVRAGFYGTVRLGTNLLSSLNEGGDYFLARLDDDGRALWGRHIGSIGFGSAGGYRVATDGADRVYLLGPFGSTVIVDGKMLFSANWASSFLAAWDSAGQLLWTQKLPRYAVNFTPDAAGNVFLIGMFDSPICLGTNSFISRGGTDAFIAKLATADAMRFASPIAHLYVSNGQFRLQLLGCGGRGPVIIEASTNLTHWTPVLTNTAPTEPFEFCEPMELEHPSRFYRARRAD